MAPTFISWVESLSEDFFEPTTYKGYGQVKNAEAICDVIEQRHAFKVRLINYDHHLVRPPDKPDDFLPRYHKVCLGVLVTRPVALRQLTLNVRRVGSKVGDQNVELLTLNLEEPNVGKGGILAIIWHWITKSRKQLRVVGREKKLTVYVFDPYNAAFSHIEIDFLPMIDLGSPGRIRYPEIRDFL